MRVDNAVMVAEKEHDWLVGRFEKAGANVGAIPAFQVQEVYVAGLAVWLEFWEQWGDVREAKSSEQNLHEMKEAIRRHGADMLHRLHRELPPTPSTRGPSSHQAWDGVWQSAKNHFPMHALEGRESQGSQDGTLSPGGIWKKTEGGGMVKLDLKLDPPAQGCCKSIRISFLFNDCLCFRLSFHSLPGDPM